MLEFMHYLFAIHFNVCYIVLKHGGDVDFRELVLTEDDQQTGFTARSITNDNQLLTNRCHAYNTHTNGSQVRHTCCSISLQ